MLWNSSAGTAERKIIDASHKQFSSNVVYFTVLDEGQNKWEAFRKKKYTAVKDIPIWTGLNFSEDNRDLFKKQEIIYSNIFFIIIFSPKVALEKHRSVQFRWEDKFTKYGNT